MLIHKPAKSNQGERKDFWGEALKEQSELPGALLSCTTLSRAFLKMCWARSSILKTQPPTLKKKKKNNNIESSAWPLLAPCPMHVEDVMCACSTEASACHPGNQQKEQKVGKENRLSTYRGRVRPLPHTVHKNAPS